MLRTLLPTLAACLLFAPSALAEIPPIPRVLPPEGLEIPADVRTRLETRLAATKRRMEEMKDHRADVEVFTKAVEFALLHREFYVPKDFEKADWALDEANKRLDSLNKGETPWTKATGLVVRGYRSLIDDSAQPFGLVIPNDHDFTKPCPLYIWLHGRGDKNTDLHFLYERATKVGQIAPPGAFVVHPFGRHCVGYKHAGEFDVAEAITTVGLEYGARAVVLIGFSMGGAGAWHIGAHRASEFTAVSPGAGFAETARYQKLTPDKYPPWYEQKLWGMYDTPAYVRNLFNTEVIAYSGELDKQIQAARVMEEAYQSEGRTLTHLIGPGVEHKYEPATLDELLRRLNLAAERPRVSPLPIVHVQTRTLEYGYQAWVELKGLESHWEDSRVDAEIVGQKHLRIATKNVSSLSVFPWKEMDGTTVEIDGQMVSLRTHPTEGGHQKWLFKTGDRWNPGIPKFDGPRKRQDLHGPIDHVFKRPFVVVTPTRKSKNPKFQEWMDFELEHFRQRWQVLMCAELPEKKDTEFELHTGSNVVLWGDPDSNVALAKLLDGTPLKFSDGKWTFGLQTYDGNRFVPAMVCPRRRDPYEPGGKFWYSGYLVLNSGLTFREGHDRTNSLQNPKLPDWAIIDITQPPDAFAPGRIHDAGFFDEEWKLKGPPKGP